MLSSKTVQVIHLGTELTRTLLPTFKQISTYCLTVPSGTVLDCKRAAYFAELRAEEHAEWVSGYGSTVSMETHHAQTRSNRSGFSICTGVNIKGSFPPTKCLQQKPSHFEFQQTHSRSVSTWAPCWADDSRYCNRSLKQAPFTALLADTSHVFLAYVFTCRKIGEVDMGQPRRVPWVVHHSCT